MAGKDGGSVGFAGSGVQSGNGYLTGDALRSNSVREDETALCLDCRVTFNVRNRACPKCDSDHFWLVAKWRGSEVAAEAPVASAAPARKVFRLPAPRAWRPAVLRFRSAG
jgi:RNA polymerase subunit RPABC4/transcription elongation factor Spt4